ncbi:MULTISPECIES: tripartite tricarboxylate transporter substrate binding protein [unclassified Beijerinckia]|uniref:Bug family tripartite tricarboxylate transporter substrate binding protein n=1 Tax=unclassified Beijerinckia TaxID=2638183 RepID=UPI001114E877|nr:MULTISPECIES: tripartite tricarboxylate transporter substrate binding protein [unclassified Beijerinckia]
MRIIVGFPAGGSMDIVARLLGEKLGAQMGQPFIVENRPGALGTIALNTMMTIPPDGYTLLLGTNTQIQRTTTVENNPYRLLEPIALTGVIPVTLLVNPGLGVSTLPELIEKSRTANSPLTFATPGQGSAMLLAMEMLQQRANLKLLHVPYNGGPPAVSDAAAGHVNMVSIGLPTALGQVNGNVLKPLVVLQEERTRLLPDTPTVREATGIGGINFLVWIALFSPPKTPVDIVKRLEAETGTALADKDLQAKFAEAAIDVRFAKGATLADLMASQIRLSLEALNAAGDEEQSSQGRK